MCAAISPACNEPLKISDGFTEQAHKGGEGMGWMDGSPKHQSLNRRQMFPVSDKLFVLLKPDNGHFTSLPCVCVIEEFPQPEQNFVSLQPITVFCHVTNL